MGLMERGCSIGTSIRISLFLQKSIAQRKDQQRFIYCEQPKESVLWCQKIKYIELETGGKHDIPMATLHLYSRSKS